MLHYERINFTHLFDRLKHDFGATHMTIQSGGNLNATLVREGLVDRIVLVIAPALIGGKDTPTLMDGEFRCLHRGGAEQDQGIGFGAGYAVTRFLRAPKNTKCAIEQTTIQWTLTDLLIDSSAWCQGVTTGPERVKVPRGRVMI